MMQFADIDYGLIPPHMRCAVRNYIDFGSPVGGFLAYALANDLVRAYLHADEINAAAIRDWARWLWMECPSPAWGSLEKVREWQQQRQRDRTPGEEGRCAGILSRPECVCENHGDQGMGGTGND